MCWAEGDCREIYDWYLLGRLRGSLPLDPLVVLSGPLWCPGLLRRPLCVLSKKEASLRLGTDSQSESVRRVDCACGRPCDW